MAKVPFTIDDNFLVELREAVLRFAYKQYGTSGLSVEDLTQESLTRLFENVKRGTLKTLTCNIETYVNNILKNVAREQLRQQARFVGNNNNEAADDDNDVPAPVDPGVAQEALDRWMDKDRIEEQERLQDTVYHFVENMPDPCKTILWSYYWENMSMDEIAAKMGYANANVAKTKKSRCMNDVKSTMTGILNRMRS